MAYSREKKEKIINELKSGLTPDELSQRSGYPTKRTLEKWLNKIPKDPKPEVEEAEPLHKRRARRRARRKRNRR